MVAVGLYIADGENGRTELAAVIVLAGLCFFFRGVSLQFYGGRARWRVREFAVAFVCYPEHYCRPTKACIVACVAGGLTAPSHALVFFLV